jgi:nucleoid-associated protein YgaU
LGSPKSQPDASAVGQTANVGRSTSIGGGAAKVFREFKWGLLTLFLLMVVVIGLVYDGGRKKKPAETDKTAAAQAAPEINLDIGADMGTPPSANNATPPAPVTNPTAAQGPVIESYTPTTPSVPTAPEKPVVPITPEKAGPAKPAAEKAIAAPGTTEYVVKSGDTLTKIANNMLPGRGSLKAILEANKDVLSDPNHLRVGMVLRIPAAIPAAPEVRAKPADPTKAAQPKEAKPEAASAADGSDYVVQSGDTLERIARKLFNDGRKWRELYEWNREQLADPGHLRVGQTLKIKQAKTAASPAAIQVRADKEKERREAAPSTPTKKAVATAEHAPEPVITKEEPPEVEVMSRTSPASCP